LSEDQVLAFARTISSVWTIEVLLCLARTPERKWGEEELVRELRASASVVNKGLRTLSAAGLVREEDTRFHYFPASDALRELVAALAELYKVRPLAVTAAIFEADNPVQRFANAFKIGKGPG
jgi:DNA-binding HxlR family transcriptional regulator